MQSEIITIGDELLIGQTTDTNAAFIAREFNMLGLQVVRKTTISDKIEDIRSALGNILPGTQVVIATGGLGPTSDDRTREGLCHFFNTRLVENEMVLIHIRQLLAKKGFSLNETNKKQALVPQSCEILSNELGTAPGMVFYQNGTMFIFLPGVPFEMKWLIENQVIPLLKSKFILPPVLHRNILTSGGFEARLSELLSEFEHDLPPGFSLAYLPSPGIIRLRLSCYSPTNESNTHADILVEKLKSFIPEYFVDENFDRLEAYCAHLLIQKSLTVSTAESCTGGKIAGMLTSVPGSSAYFKGSIVAYANEIKEKVLGVNINTLQKHGAVSREVVEEMSENGRRLLNTDYCIAVSGIAGPDGGTTEKPVGIVWISISSATKTETVQFVFGDNRERNILRASNAALNMLRKMIENER
jgi:nicotinamide-nucleotide amidase